MLEHDVVGIGNAIVDIIGRCDDAFLAQHGCTKGSMQLVDAARMGKLYEAMGPGVEISGGSVANTMVGIASFGGKAGFIGKTAKDQFGEVFGHDIRAAGVTFKTPQAAPPSEPTGRCLVLVTPDGQRTMHTSLGVSPELGGGEVDAPLLRSARIVYLEGYLFDRPQAKAAFREAAVIAAKAGRQVALSLSDPFCVDRHRAEFMGLVKNSVDILFANEVEIMSLYQTTSFDEAARRVQADTRLAALTRSEKGSVILGGGRPVAVPAAPVARVVDTTGAGDLYAAGFLLGIARGLDLESAGRLGSLAAAEIIGHVGARPEVSLHDLARSKGLLGVTTATITLETTGVERAFHFRPGTSDDGVIRQVFQQQQYALQRLRRYADLTELVDKQAAQGRRPLVIDAGANIGASVVYLAAKYPTCKVVAIEPAADNFELLVKNTGGLDVEAQQAALASSSGSSKVVDAGLGYWGYRTESAGGGSGGVPNVTVGDIYRRHEQGFFPFMVKIDIEGAEQEVFSANTEWVAETPVIIVELHDWMLPRQGSALPFLRTIAGLDRDFLHLGENAISIANKLG